MSDTLAREHEPFPESDRRASARQVVRSLAYVALDEGNGGIILNLSEGGLSVQAVTSLMDDFLPGVRFQLSEADSWIETNARITWARESRKLAGIEFIGLSEESRGRIRNWLNREAGAEALPEVGAIPAPLEEPQAAAETTEIPSPSFTQPFEPLVAGTISEPVGAPEGDLTGERSEAPAEEASEAPAELAPSAPHPALPASTGAAAAERPSATPVPAAAATPKTFPSSRPESHGAFDIDRLLENRWSVATLLLMLALASLVAGWAAGQGAIGRYLSLLRPAAGQTSAGETPVAPQLHARAARPAQIEVVNTANQRWSIPFSGALNAPADPIRHQLPAAAPGSSASSEPTPARKPDFGFRTWIVAPPSRSANGGGAPMKEPPPELSESPNPNENVLTPSGGFSARALAPPPNLAAPSTSTGVVKQAQLIYRVDPVYPEVAKEQHSEGTVRLNVTVGPDGMVRGVALLGGPRLLVEAAEKAVRQWRYTPTLLDGKAVEFQREVDLTFRLAGSAR